MSIDNKFIRSLIQSAKQGNNAAIEQLFQMNLGKIYAFALRLTANKSLAESITKETFIEAWKKISLVRPDASFLKWLNAIAVYKTIDNLRAQKQDPKKFQSDAKEIQSKDELDGYILNLPDQERMVFVLNKLESYTVEEISDLMGIKKDQVNTHLNIANDKIIENDLKFKTPEVLKERVSKLVAEIEPPTSVRDGIFSYIMEEKLKEQKEIEKIAAQVEKEEKDLAGEKLEESKEGVIKEEIIIPKKKFKFNLDQIKKIVYILIAGVVVFIAYKLITAKGDWEIMQFTGQPMMNDNVIKHEEAFPVNSVITTDNQSVVTISIPEIGRVMIDTLSVVKRMDKASELKVEKGQIKKYEGNATDLLTVQTPLAIVKEFYQGSAFKLRIVSNNANFVNVESGWVTVIVNEFTSYIPKNYDCLISRGRYVLPYYQDTNPELKSLIQGFSGGNDPTVGTILSLVTKREAIVLWHLLQLVTNEDRFVVFDKLNELVPAPTGVTKKGIQGLNKNMLMKWRQEIELKMD